MKDFIILTTTAISLILLCLVFPQGAYAYIDLGSGSYIFQLVIAFLVGGLFAVKVFWARIKNFFRNLGGRKDKDSHGRK